MFFPHTRGPRAARALIVAACLALPALQPALAGTYCVGNTVELLQALQSAASDPADDTIRVEQGTYLIDGSVQFLQDGGLRLLGGYSAGCFLRLGYASSTVLTGPAPAGGALRSVVLQLGMDAGDNRVERLTFRNFARVLLSDSGAAGALTVNQNRFEDNDTGLVLSIRATDLRVENNHLRRNRNLCCGGDFLNRGLLIVRGTPAQAITLDVRFNTITGSAFGMDIRGAGPYSAPPRLQNNIVWGNSAFDLALDAVDVVATNNIWDSQDLDNGAGFTTLTLHIGSDPLLQPDGSLQVPDSPAINSGTSFVLGGLTATDVAGNPRKVGSAPDRGAFESSLNDITDLVVTTTANSGAGSLRQAIVDANNTLNGATISFDIPGGCPQVIAPTSELPALVRPTIVDGWSQPGSERNNSETSYDAVHCIGLVGGGARQDGLRLQTQAASDEMTVQGLAFYGFARYGIHATGPGNAYIAGNTFGTGLPIAIANKDFGSTAIRVDDTRYSLIGGYSNEERNVIGRAQLFGIHLAGSDDVSIVGNFIGVGTDGSSDIGYPIGPGTGVFLEGGSENRVEYNRIGWGSAGVFVSGDGSGHSIRANHIGITPEGDDIGNSTRGVQISGGTQMHVVDNAIANNGSHGVLVTSSVGVVRMELNRIHDNSGLGIDVHPFGVSPEDTDTGATGPNRGQNAPELLLAEGSATTGTVEGELRSSNGSYKIMVYASDACDPSGFGEGQYVISGGKQVTISNGTAIEDGVAAFSIDVQPWGGLGSMLGKAITATATYEGGTSEFSQCIVFQAGSGVFKNGFE